MFSYENSREYFNNIVKMYKDYLELYRFFNAGSLKGATKFADFYWIHSYLHRDYSLAAQENIVR